METALFVVITLALIISIPFVIDAIRKKDFQDQISGKKKMRKAPKSFRTNYDKPSGNSATDQIVQRGIEQVKIDTKSIHL